MDTYIYTYILYKRYVHTVYTYMHTYIYIDMYVYMHIYIYVFIHDGYTHVYIAVAHRPRAWLTLMYAKRVYIYIYKYIHI